MKTKIQSLLIALACFAGVHQLSAQGTAFTYQGRLNNGGSPATGLYDFRFKLYVDPFGNTQAGFQLPDQRRARDQRTLCHHD